MSIVQLSVNVESLSALYELRQTHCTCMLIFFFSFVVDPCFFFRFLNVHFFFKLVLRVICYVILPFIHFTFVPRPVAVWAISVFSTLRVSAFTVVYTSNLKHKLHHVLSIECIYV
jgi:hypothetical protein